MKDYFYQIGKYTIKKVYNSDDIIYKSPPYGCESVSTITHEKHGSSSEKIYFSTMGGCIMRSEKRANESYLYALDKNNKEITIGKTRFAVHLKAYEFHFGDNKIFYFKFKDFLDQENAPRFRIVFSDEDYEDFYDDERTETYYDINKPTATNYQIFNEIILTSRNSTRPSLYLTNRDQNTYSLAYSSPWTGASALAICTLNIFFNH